jgi:flagellar basal body-associated protein FliL
VKKNMRKRAFLIMLFPIVVILWVIGWSLFWTGSETRSKTTPIQAKKDDGIQIIVAPPEEITTENQ